MAAVAIAGGVLSLLTAMAVAVSVMGRWLISAPIPGDIEIVKMATAMAAFSFLPFCQIKRGNVMVDTFTLGLSERAKNIIDGIWDLVYAVVAAVMSVGLIIGTMDAIKSQETTMMLQWLLWPSIGVCAALAALLCSAAVISSVRCFAGGK